MQLLKFIAKAATVLPGGQEDKECDQIMFPLKKENTNFLERQNKTFPCSRF